MWGDTNCKEAEIKISRYIWINTISVRTNYGRTNQTLEELEISDYVRQIPKSAMESPLLLLDINTYSDIGSSVRCSSNRSSVEGINNSFCCVKRMTDQVCFNGIV